MLGSKKDTVESLIKKIDEDSNSARSKRVRLAEVARELNEKNKELIQDQKDLLEKIDELNKKYHEISSEINDNKNLSETIYSTLEISEESSD